MYPKSLDSRNLLTASASFDVWLANQLFNVAKLLAVNTNVYMKFAAMIKEYHAHKNWEQKEMSTFDIHVWFGTIMDEAGRLFVDPISDNNGQLRNVVAMFELYTPSMLATVLQVSISR